MKDYILALYTFYHNKKNPDNMKHYHFQNG